MKKEKEKVEQKTNNNKPIKQTKKNNLSSNSKRIIFWAVIWIFILICAFAGYWAFDNGYGETGELRAKLKPIVTSFNSLNGVKKYNTIGIKIEPKLTKNSISVNYITNSSTATFNFEHMIKNNKDTLYLKYNASDETTANVVIILMLDAVNITQGHKEGELFTSYTLDSFKTTTIEDGIQLIENSDNSKEIYINLNNSILDKVINNEVIPIEDNPNDIVPDENMVPDENTVFEENTPVENNTPEENQNEVTE